MHLICAVKIGLRRCVKSNVGQDFTVMDAEAGNRVNIVDMVCPSCEAELNRIKRTIKTLYVLVKVLGIVVLVMLIAMAMLAFRVMQIEQCNTSLQDKKDNIKDKLKLEEAVFQSLQTVDDKEPERISNEIFNAQQLRIFLRTKRASEKRQKRERKKKRCKSEKVHMDILVLDCTCVITKWFSPQDGHSPCVYVRVIFSQSFDSYGILPVNCGDMFDENCLPAVQIEGTGGLLNSTDSNEVSGRWVTPAWFSQTDKKLSKLFDTSAVNKNGQIKVTEDGLYIVYAQMAWFEGNAKGYHVKKAPEKTPIASCIPYSKQDRGYQGTCSTMKIVNLRKGDFINVEDIDGNSKVLYTNTSTFFGLVKIGAISKR